MSSASDYSSDVLPLECQAPRAHWQEWFSWAFVQSVASAAGLACDVKPIDVNQMDMLVVTPAPLDGAVRVIALQCKSTHSPVFVNGGTSIAHDLEAARYNRLLEPSTVPRYLVVVAVTSPPNPLVNCMDGHATLQAAAWWHRVEGDPVTEQKSKRVHLPTSQRLDADGLVEMLKAA